MRTSLTQPPHRRVTFCHNHASCTALACADSPAPPSPRHLWHLLQAQQPGLVRIAAQRPLEEGVGGAVDALQL